jgi:hypothetical protein
MPLDVMPGGYNPMRLPPVQREWGGGGRPRTPGIEGRPRNFVNSHGPGSGAPPTAPGFNMANSSGGNTPGNLPFGMVNSSGPGRGNLPPMGGGFGGFGGGGGFSSMMNPNMVQGPSFMQQPSGGYAQERPKRVGGAGGMVDPNFRRMMDFKAAGGMGSSMAQRPGANAQYGPGAFGVSPSLYYQHFDNQGMPLPKQQPQQQMGGGDPMQMMMQMMPFWQMYSQMLGNRGQQGY